MVKFHEKPLVLNSNSNSSGFYRNIDSLSLNIYKQIELTQIKQYNSEDKSIDLPRGCNTQPIW